MPYEYSLMRNSDLYDNSDSAFNFHFDNLM